MQEITAADLGPRARVIADYYFHNPGKTRKQMAEALGVNESRISQVLNHPKVRRYYRIVARAKFEDMVPKATKAYEELIERSSNDAVREKAAARVLANEKILDNSQEITIKHDITTKTVIELQQMITNAVAAPTQDVIEGEVVPETTQDTTHLDSPDR